MKLPFRINTGKPESVFDKFLEKELSSYSRTLGTIINNGIKFADNVNCAIKEVADTGLADSEFSVAHGLGRTPVGYFIIGRDCACSVYDGGSANTATTLYLRCSVANAALKVLII